MTGPGAGIVVVGGGIAGLVTAWELARAGMRPQVIEKASAVGGCIARHTVAGIDLDAGAESYATATPAVRDLIRDLGLESAVVTPNPVGAWVRHACGTAPLPTASLLGIPSRPFAADVRQVLGLAGSLRASMDLVLPAGVGLAPGDPAVRLGVLVARRMGRTVVDRLVEPVAGGVYSTDPDELDVDAVQPKLRATVRQAGSLSKAVRQLRGGGDRPGSAVGGLSGGLFGLVKALQRDIEALGGTIDTGTGVASVARDDRGWLVQDSTGTRIVPEVVLAVPGPAAADLLRGAGIQTPTTATSDVVLVTLVLDHAGLDAHPRGTGVLVSRHSTGVSAKALTHATAKWAWLAAVAGQGRHVLRLSYGRGGAVLPERAKLVDLALADAAVLTGVPLDASSLVDSDVVSWTSALPRPQPGHRDAMNRLRNQVGGRPGLHVTGSMVAGTGLAAVVGDARAVANGILSAGRSTSAL